jgi:hypothetical protein
MPILAITENKYSESTNESRKVKLIPWNVCCLTENASHETRLPR